MYAASHERLERRRRCPESGRHGVESSSRAARQASATAAPLRSVPADAAVADVFGTLSVRVGITRTCVGAHAEAVGGDLLDLGEESLPHLGAAVVHLHGAIAIDEHQRAALVDRTSP